ncbi:MAG: DUF4340 domain-containing protein [Clostridia bacterium]|jgi:hypothetical protein|nr:DUF4340 domain-containing protein [Clostridia bacterium]
MKNKRKITIISLVVLNIIAYGAYFALSYANKLSSSADKSIYVSSTHLGDINRISCTNSDGTFTFEKQNDKWSCTDVKDFQVSQKIVDDLAEKSANLVATRKVDSNGNLTDFGLDSPQFKITLADTDGKSVTYDIGNLNSDIRKYYVKCDDSKDVYLIKSNYGDHIIRKLKAYSAPYDLSAIEKSSVSKITISDANNELLSIIKGKKDSNSPLGSDSEWKFGSVFSNDTNVNTYKVDSLWDKLNDAASSDCAAFDIDNQKLKKYGLVAPKEKITIDYSADTGNKSFTLSVSKENDDGSAYVMFSDSNVIGLAKSDTVKSLLGYLDAYNILPQSICAAKLKMISGLTVTYNGKTYDYSIKTANGKNTYTLNNAECNAENFEAFYRKLSALDSESHTTDGSTASAAEEGSIIAVYHPSNTSYSDLKIVLSPYNSDYYIASFNGIDGRLVNKKSVETVISLLQNAK